MKALFAAAAFAAATVAHAEAADPCVNFFAYVNQRWIDSTELPPDRARIGSFDALRIGVARLLVQEDGSLKAGEPISLVPEKATEGKEEQLSADGITRFGGMQLPAGMTLRPGTRVG